MVLRNDSFALREKRNHDLRIDDIVIYSMEHGYAPGPVYAFAILEICWGVLVTAYVEMYSRRKRSILSMPNPNHDTVVGNRLLNS